MKSKIFGILTLATFTVTIAAYSSVGSRLENQSSASLSGNSRYVESYQTLWPWSKQKATSLAAVGWKGCKWCERFKETTLPALLDEGYDVRYVDIADWDGPKVRVGPTLFYFAEKNKIVKVEKGYRTPEQVKEYLEKPDEE